MKAGCQGVDAVSVSCCLGSGQRDGGAAVDR